MLVADEEEDINDAFDSIALGEESVKEESFQEGEEKGRICGLSEGYHLGFHRGAEIGAELGYYSAFTSYYLSLLPGLSDKVSNCLEKLKEKVRSVPTENLESFDVHGALDASRALFKKSCALLKIDSCLPVKQDFDT
ncbi:oral cancer-overexpressed protein 1 homolog [Cimex lectularius]|uniref:Essential protein Yae1 N-terminal domain-containing protein n=1 Tax=Cimex lectularius TaxID=79782 RepID=A0A8I6R859_CIMLE|nr:oral cancer-overexpressed protein 1 homolog [Cimex lectularius]